MRKSSRFCSATGRPGFEGQSILLRVATHAPRNSRSRAGGEMLLRTYAPEPECAVKAIHPRAIKTGRLAADRGGLCQHAAIDARSRFRNFQSIDCLLVILDRTNATND